MIVKNGLYSTLSNIKEKNNFSKIDLINKDVIQITKNILKNTH
jgi:hypothetical protein